MGSYAYAHIQSLLYLYRETLSSLGYAVILQKEIRDNIPVYFKEYICVFSVKEGLAAFRKCVATRGLSITVWNT